MEHPKLELDISFSDRPADLLENGFDLAIRNGEIGEGIGLMTVCASPNYLAKHGRPETLEDLSTHQAITYGRDVQCRKWQFPTSNGGLLDATPSSRLRLDDLEAIADAAEAGHGLAWLPCWLIRDRVRSGLLVPLLGDVPRLVFKTHALWPVTPHLSLRVRLAINAIAAELPGYAEL
jgi:DNA-binding transcriptional LysR family regulator